MSETFASDFIAKLQAGYTEAHDRRVQRLLSVAGDLDSTDYLYAAFAWAPREMRHVLSEMAFATNAPLHERATAGAHLLHGANEGWWQVSDKEAERARALIAAHEKETPMRETPMRRAAVADLTADSPLVDDIAIMKACAQLNATLKDPAANSASKLDAISRYFRVVGRIAPDRLDAAVADACAKVQP